MEDRREAGAGEDEAVFAPARLGRGGTPRAGIAIVLVVGGLALAGFLGRTGDGRTAVAQATIAPAATPAPTVDVAGYREAPWRTRPGTGEPFSAPLLTLDVRFSGSHLFLKGAVFTPEAAVVVVTIRDGDDAALKVRSVVMPGGSTAFRIGANDGFDLAFAADDWPSAAASVTATAYDSTGYPIEVVQTAVARSRVQDRWRPGAGM